MIAAFILGGALNQAIDALINKTKQAAKLEAKIAQAEQTTYEEDATAQRIEALMNIHNINEVEASQLNEIKEANLHDIRGATEDSIKKLDEITLMAIKRNNLRSNSK